MNDLIPIENPNPQALFVPGGLDPLLARIAAEARALVPDTTTAKGREAIASNARRVASSKTYLDGIGQEYVAELKRLPGQVDAARRAMRKFLDGLRDEIRRPLTEWEEAKRARQQQITDRIATIRRQPPDGMPPEFYESLIADLRAAVLTEEDYGDDLLLAHQARDEALNRLDAQRIAALHQLAEEQTRREAEAAAEQARIEAAVEQTRREAEAAAERAKREAEAAIERTRREAEEKARAADLFAAAQLRNEENKRRIAELEAQRAAERAAEAVRLAEERVRARIAAEKAEAERQQAARLADAKHKAAVNNEVLQSILSEVVDIPEPLARAVVIAIARGKITHVKIQY